MGKVENLSTKLSEKLTRPRNLRLSWIMVTSVLFLVLAGQLTESLTTSLDSDFPQVLKKPFSYQAHLELAQAHLNLNNFQQATHELKLARDLTQNNNMDVLGARSGLAKLETAMQLALETPVAEETFWQDLLTKYPDYKDGLSNLAILSYDQGNTAKTRTYLTMLITRFPDVIFNLPPELKDLLN